MSEHSHIEWTEATWNVLAGCTKVSAGCKNCYAIRTANRLSHNPNPKVSKKYEGTVTLDGKNWTGRVNFDEESLMLPLKWAEPKRIFVNSVSDLFHPAVSDDDIERIFAVMALAQRHTFQVLTKQPERALRWFTTHNTVEGMNETCETGVAARAQHIGKVVWDARGNYPWKYQGVGTLAVQNRRAWPGWPLPNVWLGVSVEDQKTADERIPLLLQTPAAVRFLSCEPLLGPVDLLKSSLWTQDELAMANAVGMGWANKLHWVICGGESGHGARPMHPDWARSLRDQCIEAQVPFFFKQWGDLVDVDTAIKAHGFNPYTEHPAFYTIPGYALPFTRVGKKEAGRLLDGKEHSEFPTPQPA